MRLTPRAHLKSYQVSISAPLWFFFFYFFCFDPRQIPLPIRSIVCVLCQKRGIFLKVIQFRLMKCFHESKASREANAKVPERTVKLHHLQPLCDRATYNLPDKKVNVKKNPHISTALIKKGILTLALI